MRIDLLMVEKGLVESRETAQRLILAGKVLLGDKPALKPGQTADAETPLSVVERLKYASRGGLKLEKALEEFGVNVTNKVVVDVGASTGGFTDVLLARGASKVYAVDVGYGQLAWKLRHDPRVTLMERTNARNLTPDLFVEPVDLAVVDVSFIGAQLILAPLARITAEVVVLVKPQFEAGPQDVPRGGVIRDPEVHRRVLERFCEQLQAWRVHGMIDSPILGGEGNREFLLLLKQSPGWSGDRIQFRIRELIA